MLSVTRVWYEAATERLTLFSTHVFDLRRLLPVMNPKAAAIVV